MNAVEHGRKRIVLGDINAKSPIWGAKKWDKGGEIWVDWISSLDPAVLNDGKEPTWRRGTQSSFIDLTCATQGSARKIRGWRLMSEESLSDHGFITFDVERESRTLPAQSNIRSVLDLKVIEQSMKQELRDIGEENIIMEALAESPKRAQDIGTIRRRGEIQLLPYWWTQRSRQPGGLA